MPGLTQQDARFGLRYGWTQLELLNASEYLRRLGISPDEFTPTSIRFNGQWAIYKGRPINEVQEAVAGHHDLKDIPAYIWADGSGTTADCPAGIGVVVLNVPFQQRLEISEYIGLGTNNYAELMAIFRGLQAIPDRKRKILIRSDSQYAIGSITKPWKSQANRELILDIRSDVAWRHGNVEFEHVAGHAGIEENERCDVLANLGRKKGLK